MSQREAPKVAGAWWAESTGPGSGYGKRPKLDNSAVRAATKGATVILLCPKGHPAAVVRDDPPMLVTSTGSVPVEPGGFASAMCVCFDAWNVDHDRVLALLGELGPLQRGRPWRVPVERVAFTLD